MRLQPPDTLADLPALLAAADGLQVEVDAVAAEVRRTLLASKQITEVGDLLRQARDPVALAPNVLRTARRAWEAVKVPVAPEPLPRGSSGSARRAYRAARLKAEQDSPKALAAVVSQVAQVNQHLDLLEVARAEVLTPVPDHPLITTKPAPSWR